jgi:hypothetical protein
LGSGAEGIIAFQEGDLFDIVLDEGEDEDGLFPPSLPQCARTELLPTSSSVIATIFTPWETGVPRSRLRLLGGCAEQEEHRRTARLLTGTCLLNAARACFQVHPRPPATRLTVAPAKCC